MLIDNFLAQLENVRRCGHGWMARCPAHAEKTGSLKIDEGDDGKILLFDFGAHCTPEQVCSSLGLAVKDLWPEWTGRRPLFPSPQLNRFDWRHVSARLMTHSDLLWLRGSRTLAAATGIGIETWSDTDLDVALTAVDRAYRDLDHASVFEDVAFTLRQRHLLREHQERRRG